VAIVLSLPRLPSALLHALELVLDLSWLLIAVAFHLLRSSLFALGLGGREKARLIKEQARHFAGEVKEDARKLVSLPASVMANFARALRLVRSLVDRLAGKLRPWAGGPRGLEGESRSRAYGFEADYELIERLPPGGSTARLFVVRPRAPSRLRAAGPGGERMVLKYFDLSLGSHLENIVRESGAVRLATQLGLVLDSKMSPASFYYVMPYYEGKTLTEEVRTIHRSLAEGARPPDEDLRRCLRWLRDLLETIVAYHERGVFHKDIKPDNLIVEGERLRLVDIGLLTPLESTLQLTTHGTECFRDPDMVRLAARGVSVRDVDCAKFDVYSIGAVLYFMADGGFPASGSLSRWSRPVPPCLEWISSRAMADFAKRYASSREMLRDVEEILALPADSPLDETKVSSLPSFHDGEVSSPQVGTAPPAASPERPVAQVAEAAPGLAPGATARGGSGARLLKLGAAVLILAGALGAGAALVYEDARQSAARAAVEALFHPVVPEEAAPVRRFPSRQDAARWIAEDLDDLQPRAGELGARIPIVPVLPGPAEDPEARELLRELKLALAHRAVPFATRAEAAPAGEPERGARELRLRASRRDGLRRVEGELSGPGGAGRWAVEYP
ncbi:MAG: hypothetical protein HY721_35590, partial [Planctomycetes bacterium]|nr:hypothetical protein [Planctomycetota bacterium]